MKKTLVAAAALAFVGAASAQSSVTLYGKIDWEVVSKTARAVTTGVRTNPGIKVDSAGLSGSRVHPKTRRRACSAVDGSIQGHIDITAAGRHRPR